MAARKRKLPADDDGSVTEFLPLPEPSVGVGPAPGEPDRDRSAFCEGVDLGPQSLVGSWFLRFENGEPIWWGIVVAEPQAGKYLLEIHEGAAAYYQRVIPIERIMWEDDGYEFRFYDTQDDLRGAYALWVATAETPERT